MNRRSFFRRIGAAIAGVALSSKLGCLLPAPPALATPDICFPPDAFKLTQVDGEMRLDVFYGWATVRPEYMVRIEG